MQNYGKKKKSVHTQHSTLKRDMNMMMMGNL